MSHPEFLEKKAENKELLFSSTSDTLQKPKERELEALVAQAFGVEPILDI